MHRKAYNDLSVLSCENPEPWAFHGEFFRKKCASIRFYVELNISTLTIHSVLSSNSYLDIRKWALTIVSDNFCDDSFINCCDMPFVFAENFQGLPPEAIPAFLQNLQNSASYNIAKPIARPAAYHPYHRPSHQPPQRHLPPNAHHTLQQLFYRGPYLTGKFSSFFI